MGHRNQARHVFHGSLQSSWPTHDLLMGVLLLVRQPVDQLTAFLGCECVNFFDNPVECFVVMPFLPCRTIYHTDHERRRAVTRQK